MEQKRRFMEQKVHLWNRSASLSTLWNKQRNLWRKKIPAINNNINNLLEIIFDLSGNIIDNVFDYQEYK